MGQPLRKGITILFCLVVIGVLLIPFYGRIYSFVMMQNDDLRNEKKTIVIYPLLTANAYGKNGFYDYYKKECDISCLSVQIDPDIKMQEQGSQSAMQILTRLGYSGMTDFELDRKLKENPEYLNQYEKVIILHSEYVTKSIYDSLQKHPKVIYLAPNALYAEVEIRNDTMTLIRGHGYHTDDNAFGWEYENTHPYEYDKSCKHWKFIPIQNGYQLNCNPELTIYKNFEMLKALKGL